VLSLIPWPGPTVFKISCPRDHASVVRKLVQKVNIVDLTKLGLTKCHKIRSTVHHLVH